MEIVVSMLYHEFNHFFLIKIKLVYYYHTRIIEVQPSDYIPSYTTTTPTFFHSFWILHFLSKKNIDEHN